MSAHQTFRSIRRRVIRQNGVTKAESPYHEKLPPTLRESLQAFRDPALFKDLLPAAERLRRAVATGERVVVYGDYDCDGITSVTTLVRFLRHHGLKPVPLLASRERGYGLSGIPTILSHDPSLVVVCDCGTSDEPAVRELREHSIDTIIIDHHTVPADPANHPATYLVNPKRPDSEHPFQGLCSASLSWVLCWQVALMMGDGGNGGDDLGVVESLLPLTALGQTADAGDMRWEGRLLTRLGLDRWHRNGDPWLDTLVRASLSRTDSADGPGQGPFSNRLEPHVDIGSKRTHTTLGWTVGPMINAAGRLGDPELALQYLLAETDLDRDVLAKRLHTNNLERRRLTESALQLAREQLDQPSRRDGSDGVVLVHGDWPAGISGLVASRLADECQSPVLALSTQSWSGSARGWRVVGVYAVLKDLFDTGVLTRFGGHAVAAGFSTIEELLPQLVAAVGGYTTRQGGIGDASPPIEIDVGDITTPLINLVQSLGPFGVGFDEPIFKIRDRVKRFSRMGKDRIHARIELDGSDCTAIAWNRGVELSELGIRAGKEVVITGRLTTNSWNGTVKPQLIVDSVTIDKI